MTGLGDKLSDYGKSKQTRTVKGTPGTRPEDDIIY